MKWQSTVPEHWLPLIAVATDPARGQIALELGSMLRPTLQEIRPVGRILAPAVPAGTQYRIAEEEIPRSGVSRQR